MSDLYLEMDGDGYAIKQGDDVWAYLPLDRSEERDYRDYNRAQGARARQVLAFLKDPDRADRLAAALRFAWDHLLDPQRVTLQSLTLQIETRRQVVETVRAALFGEASDGPQE